jgi:hypothetical protein
MMVGTGVSIGTLPVYSSRDSASAVASCNR